MSLWARVGEWGEVTNSSNLIFDVASKIPNNSYRTDNVFSIILLRVRVICS